MDNGGFEPGRYPCPISPGIQFLYLRVPRFLSRPRFSIYGLIVGFCAFGDGPVLGHNSEITNRHQTHIKPTSSPRQTHTMADSMCTPNPHQTQIEPRGHPDRKKEPRRETVTRPTLNPHQAYIKPTTQQTAGAHTPTTQQTVCAHHGAHQTQTKPIKRGQHARQTKI